MTGSSSAAAWGSRPGSKPAPWSVMTNFTNWSVTSYATVTVSSFRRRLPHSIAFSVISMHRVADAVDLLLAQRREQKQLAQQVVELLAQPAVALHAQLDARVDLVLGELAAVVEHPPQLRSSSAGSNGLVR